MDRLKELRKEKNKTLKDIALYLNSSTQVISRYELGQREPDYNTLRKLADYFNVSTDYLLGNSDLRNLPSNAIETKTITMPIIGTIAAGYGIDAINDYIGEIDVPKRLFCTNDSDDYFVLKVNGDSMSPKFLDGDKVLVFKTPSVDSGTIAVVGYNGYEATLKIVKYVKNENWMSLIPINPEYPIKHIKGTDLEECQVYGKVVYLFREI